MTWFTKTIDSVIGDLQNKVEQLHELVELHEQKAAEHKAKSAEHAASSIGHSLLGEKAKRIAQNITALLS